MVRRWHSIQKWLTPGIGVKRWVLMLGLGITLISLAAGYVLIEVYRAGELNGLFSLLTLSFLPPILRIIIGLVAGLAFMGLGLLNLNRSILAPFLRDTRVSLIDSMYRHSRRQRGLKLVALGGGTGLPAVLRGFKTETSNITAIVTVADDGGSSGLLRRELGILPPGDLRNNIAALADDEALMTQLFQYRFGIGGLEGHSFGNLFITALASITGSMESALAETGRVLAIQGRVLPSTLQDVTLMAEVRSPNSPGLRRVVGESKIPESGGVIERVFVSPENARAYPESIRAILNANLIVIGPGSLYTSIIPNLLIRDIPEAIRASDALRIYVCNVAIQTGETDHYTVADHVTALERHVGRGLFSVVIANNVFPELNRGSNTDYVMPVPEGHEITRRYEICEADLTDPQYPWRHDPAKLSRAILSILVQHHVLSSSETAKAG